MKCPTCPSSTLVMSERQGIEIDYCPTCRGVWLDRGELDKIVQRSQAETFAPAGRGAIDDDRSYRDRSGDVRTARDRDDDRHFGDRSYDARSTHPGKKHKKKGLLGELFDF